MTAAKPRIGLSLPTKVFLSFAAIIVAFVASSGYGLVRHHRTLQDLALLSGGLLPVSLAVAEIRTTQELFVTTLESDPTGRAQFLSTVRGLRPGELRGTARALRGAASLSERDEDVAALDEMARELEAVARRAEGHEARYRELFAAIDAGDHARADGLLRDLTRGERSLNGRLRGVQDSLDARIADIARAVEQAERNLLWALLVLTGVALAAAAGVTLYSYLAIAPLSRLTDGVVAVGAGDLSQRVDIASRDEIGALAREFNRMTAALVEREARLKREERLAAIGQLASKVTHEIRNPLNVLRLNAEMLIEDIAVLGDPADTAGPLKQLSTMTEVLGRLEALTEEYLRYARLPKPHLAETSPTELVEDFVGLHRADLEMRGIEVDLELDPATPLVPLDEAQIQQVLSNLVRNAGEAMPEGGTLTIRVAAEDGGVRLEVGDTGEGIDPEHVDSIFDPFFTTKERGTGLGLPLANQIVSEHGGRIACSSEVGEGSSFTIWLPATGSPGRPPAEEKEEG